MNEHSEPLFDRGWLHGIIAKKKLIDRAYELKKTLPAQFWKDALRIYEAEDKYLNRLSSEVLEKLVKDLERRV